MSPDRWIATAAGLALIAFIVWFFWLKRSTGFRAPPHRAGCRRGVAAEVIRRIWFWLPDGDVPREAGR
jgi:hypothetical protein